jgi:hypothetical protein
MMLLKHCSLDDLAHKIQLSNKSIKDYQPKQITVEFPNAERDVFREQLQFALAGERKYSSAVLSDLNSLDSVWILLRNSGIFSTDGTDFEEIRGQMADYYTQNCRPAECALSLAYLLSYDRLALLGHS